MLNRRPTRRKRSALAFLLLETGAEKIRRYGRRSTDMTLLLIAAGITLVALLVLAVA